MWLHQRRKRREYCKIKNLRGKTQCFFKQTTPATFYRKRTAGASKHRWKYYQLMWHEKHLDEKTLSLSVAYLIIFIPGQAFGSQDEPVPLGASFHDPNVADGEPALADHLQDSTSQQRSLVRHEPREPTGLALNEVKNKMQITIRIALFLPSSTSNKLSSCPR